MAKIKDKQLTKVREQQTKLNELLTVETSQKSLQQQLNS